MSKQQDKKQDKQNKAMALMMKRLNRKIDARFSAAGYGDEDESEGSEED
jgi:hypothetical protein